MAFNPISPVNPNPPTQAQLLAQCVNQLNATVVQAARTLFNAYNTCVTTALANPNGLATTDINAALDADSAKTGRMSSTDLSNFAAIAKAVVNQVSPGQIADSVPAATITMPVPAQLKK